MNNRRKLRLCLIGDIRNVHCKKWVRYFVYRGHDVHFVDDHPYGYKNLKLACLKNYTGIKALDYASRLIRARKLIRKLKPDLVHAQQVTYHGFLGALSGMHPFMITPWGSDILSDFEGSFINKKIKKYIKKKKKKKKKKKNFLYFFKGAPKGQLKYKAACRST